jgi:hypothetical protein
MSLGRPEDGSTGETDSDFDSFVEKRIASEFSADFAELKALADELSVYKTNLKMTTEDGQRWMSKTTEMAKKAFEYWRKKEGFVSSLYRHVKIWCFTVDCFLQTQSQRSMYSRQFEAIQIRIAFTEECHQLSLLQVAAVSAIVPQHVFVYDTAQTIDHYDGGRARAERAVFREGDMCPWEHYTCPLVLGAQTHWICACGNRTFSDSRGRGGWALKCASSCGRPRPATTRRAPNCGRHPTFRPSSRRRRGNERLSPFCSL